MEKGIRKIEQNGVHVAYFTCPQIKLNKYKNATMLSLWHIKGNSMDLFWICPNCKILGCMRVNSMTIQH